MQSLRHAPEFLGAVLCCKIAPVHENEAQHSKRSRRLELVRESKLYRLLPGKKQSSRLEASGVALASDQTALVVFDNLNQIACIDLTLKRRRTNGLQPA